MTFFALDQLASARSRSFLDKPGGCFFQELVPLTQLPVFSPEFRDLRRLGGFFAALVGGMLLFVSCDPVTYRLGDKVIRRGDRGDGALLLNDFTHELRLELLRVSRCWQGIYLIDSREEKLPHSEKHHAPHDILKSL